MRMSRGFRVPVKSNHSPDGSLFSDTTAMNNMTVNDNNENGYEMKFNAKSRNQRTDIRGSAHRSRRE